MTRLLGRLLLAAFLLVAGVAHIVVTEEFFAQVPPWLPAPRAVVLVSGVVEILLGLALLLAPAVRRPWVGLLVAGLFVAVFPGNLSQWLTGADGFGLDTDGGRAVRLLFQPLLVAWALWCTGAWALLRSRGRSGARSGSTGSPPEPPLSR